jgi:hypothetical protein
MDFASKAKAVEISFAMMANENVTAPQHEYYTTVLVQLGCSHFRLPCWFSWGAVILGSVRGDAVFIELAPS